MCVADPSRQAKAGHEAETGADVQNHASCQAESSMPQVDFAPSMAALMGVPIPFGSIGQISRPLWNVAHSMHSSGTTNCSSGTEGHDLQQVAYAEALRENAAQVEGCTFADLGTDLLCLHFLCCACLSCATMLAAGAHIPECICSGQESVSAVQASSQGQSIVSYRL